VWIHIFATPHKSLINKKEELDGSKSFASSFVKLHIFAFYRAGLFQDTIPEYFRIWPLSNSHNCIRQDLGRIKLYLEATSTIEFPRNFFRDDYFDDVSWYGISPVQFTLGATTRSAEFVLRERFYGKMLRPRQRGTVGNLGLPQHR
jgi:hypothetical protein